MRVPGWGSSGRCTRHRPRCSRVVFAFSTPSVPHSGSTRELRLGAQHSTAASFPNLAGPARVRAGGLSSRVCFAGLQMTRRRSARRGGCGPSARLWAVFGDGGAGGLSVQEGMSARCVEIAVSLGHPARRVTPSVGFAATSPRSVPFGGGAMGVSRLPCAEECGGGVSPRVRRSRPEDKLR